MHPENYGVYGARKVYAALNREGHRVARCTVERLMRHAGLHGVHRGKAPRTTAPGPCTDRPADPVRRHFTAPAPNCLWVADITYIRTFSGWVYAAFVLDRFSRRIVGWQLSTTLHTTLALDALEMRLCTRRHAGKDVSQLIHHSDRLNWPNIARSATPKDSLSPKQSPPSAPRAIVTITRWTRH